MKNRSHLQVLQTSLAVIFYSVFGLWAAVDAQDLKISSPQNGSSAMISVESVETKTALDTQNVIDHKFELVSLSSLNYGQTKFSITYSSIQKKGSCAPVFRNENIKENSVIFSNLYLFQSSKNIKSNISSNPILALVVKADGAVDFTYNDSFEVGSVDFIVSATNECLTDTVGELNVILSTDTEVKLDLTVYGEALALSGYSENTDNVEKAFLGEAMAGVFSLFYSASLTGIKFDRNAE